MRFQNIITAGIAVAVSAMYQSAHAQITPIPPTAHETGGQMYPSHFVPWPPIKENDILKKRRLWEDISISGKNNKAFALANGKSPLITVLAECVNKGKIKAYGTQDDRFTHALTTDEFQQIFTTKQPPGSRISKYAIKEDSLFLNTGKATVRILAIAPVVATTLTDGTIKEEPMFWVYYPDCRKYLSDYHIAGALTWDDLFERQQFKGVITRSTGSTPRPGNMPKTSH